MDRSEMKTWKVGATLEVDAEQISEALDMLEEMLRSAGIEYELDTMGLCETFPAPRRSGSTHQDR